MGKLFGKQDTFRLEGECSHRTETELAALDREIGRAHV